MTVADYKTKIEEIGFEEYPYVITGTETPLCEIVEYSKADLELKIHLAEVIMGRCFPAPGGIFWPKYADWYISCFLQEFKNDIPKPFLTKPFGKPLK